jgi:hypothetical protein
MRRIFQNFRISRPDLTHRRPAFTMAQKFSTSGAQTAGVLLQTIPEAQQVAIAKELNVRLRSRFDDAAASVAVELVAGRDDPSLQGDLLDVLKARIESGFPGSIASLLASFPNLSSRLVTAAVNYLADPKAHTTTRSATHPTLQSSNKDDQDGLHSIDADREDGSSDLALQWLRFTKQTLASGRAHEREDVLFQSALKFLGDPQRSTALAARDLVFSLLSSLTGQNNLAAVRESIGSLITARDSKLQQTLGYALWMRLLAVSDLMDLSSIDVNDESYWAPLLLGLRSGDAERRKMCLDILKRSVALAVEQGAVGAVARSGAGKSVAACAINIISYVELCGFVSIVG